MVDKLLESITFKCTPEIKAQIIALAGSEGKESSEFCRMAVDLQIEKRRADYLALQAIFGAGAGSYQGNRE